MEITELKNIQNENFTRWAYEKIEQCRRKFQWTWNQVSRNYVNGNIEKKIGKKNELSLVKWPWNNIKQSNIHKSPRTIREKEIEVNIKK